MLALGAVALLVVFLIVLILQEWQNRPCIVRRAAIEVSGEGTRMLVADVDKRRQLILKEVDIYFKASVDELIKQAANNRVEECVVYRRKQSTEETPKEYFCLSFEEEVACIWHTARYAEASVALSLGCFSYEEKDYFIAIADSIIKPRVFIAQADTLSDQSCLAPWLIAAALTGNILLVATTAQLSCLGHSRELRRDHLESMLNHDSVQANNKHLFLVHRFLQICDFVQSIAVVPTLGHCATAVSTNKLFHQIGQYNRKNGLVVKLS